MNPNDGAVIAESLAQPTRFAEIFDRHYDAVYSFVARRAIGRWSSSRAIQTAM